jgi:hypothetical protein
MQRNVGKSDRIVRAIGGLAMALCAVQAPFPPLFRVAVFGGMGTYLLFTAVWGTCFGYRLLGRSTCPSKLSP